MLGPEQNSQQNSDSGDCTPGFSRGQAKSSSVRVPSEPNHYAVACVQNAGLEDGRETEKHTVSIVSWYNTAMETNEKATSNAETVIIPRAEYEELKAQNRWLLEQLRVVRSKQFGPSSEKATEEVSEQLSMLFNEAEVYADEEVAVSGIPAVEVRAHSRKRKSAGYHVKCNT